MSDKKPLKIPVMDNLDDLTEDELKNYYDYWTQKLIEKRRDHNTAIENFSRLSTELARRYYNAD